MSSSGGALGSRDQILSQARRKIVSVITRRQKNWKELFVQCDKNRDGQLNLSELRYFIRNVLKIAPQAVNDYEVKVLFQEIDGDHSGTVDAVELCDYIEHGRRRPEDVAAKKARRFARVKKNLRLAMRDIGSSEAFVRQTFGRLDADGSARLTMHELEKWIRDELGLTRWDISNADLQEFFMSIDVNGDGDIEVDELHALIKQLEKERRAIGARGGFGEDASRPTSASSAPSCAGSSGPPGYNRKLRTFRQKLTESPLHRPSSLPGLRRATGSFTNLGRTRAPANRIGSTSVSAAALADGPRPVSAGMYW